MEVARESARCARVYLAFQSYCRLCRTGVSWVAVMVLGTCKSGCGRSHHGPFGMYCPYLKLAKEQAVQLYGSEDRYREVLEAITIAENSEEADGMGPGAAGTTPSDTDSVLQQLLVSSSENSSNLSKLCEALSGMHTTLKEIAGRSQTGRGQPPSQPNSSAIPRLRSNGFPPELRRPQFALRMITWRQRWEHCRNQPIPPLQKLRKVTVIDQNSTSNTFLRVSLSRTLTIRN